MNYTKFFVLLLSLLIAGFTAWSPAFRAAIDERGGPPRIPAKEPIDA